jgi:hypothetical protein
LFVFSAAFAREYDAEYIPDRPWIMLVPLGASLISSFLLWCLLWLSVAMASKKRAPFWKNYGAFLGMFWLTAPLAWLYAIPVERFMSPVDAIKANYVLLGIVAAWRVFIMIRVAQVFFGRKPLAAITMVLGFGYVLLTVALFYSPWNILDLMGGARRTDVEAAHMSIVSSSICIAILAFPAVLIAVLVQFGCSLPGYNVARPVPKPMRKPRLDVPAEIGLWALAVVSLLLWAAILPFSQPPLIGQPTESDLVDDYHKRRREYWRYGNSPPPTEPAPAGGGQD